MILTAARCAAVACHCRALLSSALLSILLCANGAGGQTASVLLRQVKQLFTSNMSALGIPTVMVPGEASHIDFINGTDREAVIVAAQGTYLDWYMLTQVCTLHLAASLTPNPRPGFCISARLFISFRALVLECPVMPIC